MWGHASLYTFPLVPVQRFKLVGALIRNKWIYSARIRLRKLRKNMAPPFNLDNYQGIFFPVSVLFMCKI